MRIFEDSDICKCRKPDLFYHVIVLMVEKGITIEDVEAEMVRRSLKQHNLKAERKPVTNV